MNPLPRRTHGQLLWLLSIIALVAVACGSGDTASSAETDAVAVTEDAEDADTEATDTDAAAQSGDGEAAAGDGEAATGDDDATSESEEAAEVVPAEPVDRDVLVANLISNMTLHTATEEEVACVSGEADDVPALSNMLDSLGANQGEAVTDEGFGALATSLNGCVDNEVLGQWAAMSMGLSGDEAAGVSGCFSDRFAGAEGDRDFRGLASQALGFTVSDEATSTATIDTLSTCVPLTAIASQLAGQAEARSNFETTVDAECVETAVASDELTRTFWTGLVSGSGQVLEDVDAIVLTCASEIESDFAAELPADFEPWSGTGALAAVEPRVRNGVYLERPPMSIDASKSFEAVIATGGGEIRLKLFPDTAPVTVNNFVSLARDGYYDGTVFHRVIADFMAQAGDPTGTGTGGPGYQFEDEVDDGPPLDKRGLLAMANAGPGTNGSQFFITFAPTEWLTGNHTVFGELVEGDDLLAAIAPRDPQAPQARGQVIESITIVES